MNRNFEAAFLSYVQQSSEIDQEVLIAKALASKHPLPEGPRVSVSKTRVTRGPATESPKSDSKATGSASTSQIKCASPKRDKPKLRSMDDRPSAEKSFPTYVTRRTEKWGVPTPQTSSADSKKLHKSSSTPTLGLRNVSHGKGSSSSKAGRLFKGKSKAKSSSKGKEVRTAPTRSPPTTEPLILHRPKRTILPKTYDNTLGLSWREENELQRALYASLHNTRHPLRSQSENDLHHLCQGPIPSTSTDPEASSSSMQSWVTSKGDGKKKAEDLSKDIISEKGKLLKSGLKLLMPEAQKLLASSGNNGTSSSDSTASSSGTQGNVNKPSTSSSMLKASLRAQRKFAQGSRPCSPSTTPVKSRPSSVHKTSQQPDLGNCKAKTEDFLTFLCLRGTSLLPPHLEHFNQPETEELPSFPNTPRQSQDGSRPATPAYSSRPATPAHMSMLTETLKNGGKKGKSSSSSRRETPDREILVDNRELGVKPLVTKRPPSSTVPASPKHVATSKAKRAPVPTAKARTTSVSSSPTSPTNTTAASPNSTRKKVKTSSGSPRSSIARATVKTASWLGSKSKLCNKKRTPRDNASERVEMEKASQSRAPLESKVCGEVIEEAVEEVLETKSEAVESDDTSPQSVYVIDSDHMYEGDTNMSESTEDQQSLLITSNPMVPPLPAAALLGAEGDKVAMMQPSSVPLPCTSAYSTHVTPPYHFTYAASPVTTLVTNNVTIPDTLSTLLPGVNVMPPDTIFQLPPALTTPAAASNIVMTTPLVTQCAPAWLPGTVTMAAVCYPSQETAGSSSSAACGLVPPDTPNSSPDKPYKHQSPSAKSHKKLGSLPIRKILPLVPARKVKGHQGRVATPTESSSSGEGSLGLEDAGKSGPAANEGKKKNKLFSRVLRSGSTQSVDTASAVTKSAKTKLLQKAKSHAFKAAAAGKKKKKPREDHRGSDPESEDTAVEIIAGPSTPSSDQGSKSVKRKSESPHHSSASKKRKSCAEHEGWDDIHTGEEHNQKSPGKQTKGHSTEKSKKRKSDCSSKSPIKAKAEIAEADSTTSGTKHKSRKPDLPQEVIVIDDSPEPKRPKARADSPKSRSPKVTTPVGKTVPKTPSPGKAGKKAATTPASAGKAKDIKHSGATASKKPPPPPSTAPKAGPSTAGEEPHVPTLSLSFREFFPAPTDLPRIVQVPTYHPSAEEFSDPISYISLIRPDAESYGICRIIPPEGWKPECKLSEELRFGTQIQYIHQLMNRWGPNVQQVECIRKHLESQGNSMEHAPLVGGIELDMAALSNAITACGGLQHVIDRNKWSKVAEILRIPKPAQEIQTRLYELYCRYLLSYDTLSADEKRHLQEQVLAERQKQRKRGNLNYDCCMAKGRSRTLSEYFRASRSMQAMWFKDGVEPSPPQVENEYWRLVEDGKHHVSVQAGHLDTRTHGGAFPTRKDSPYSRHGWNFNMLQHNQGNVLRHVGQISGVTVPMLHIGMLFSSSCWYRDPHFLPYIHYLHSGADIMWYCVPKSEASKLKAVMEDTVPDLVDTSAPIWLSEDSIMLSPSLLIEKGLSLCRTVQQNNQFMVVFPEAFTASISCGYNIAESIRFAPADWIPAGCRAAQMLQESCEQDLFSMEKLVFKLARSDKTPTDSLAMLHQHLTTIITKELEHRKQLAEAGLKQEKLSSNNRCLEHVRKRRGHNWGSGASAGTGEEIYRCIVLQKICFLSMVVNEAEGHVFCLEQALDHIQKKKNLRACTLLYRYTQKELEDIMTSVRRRLATEDPTSKRKGPKLKLASNT